jgi:hypothetical protein
MYARGKTARASLRWLCELLLRPQTPVSIAVPSAATADRLECLQVLFCYEQFDELTLLHLREFDKKKLISVETDIVVDHYKEEKFEDTSPG